MDAVVEWVDARERLPGSGYPVAAAVSGRYRAEPGEAIHGPARAPAGDEVLKPPGGVVQILTPTATLEWALRDRYRPAAVARLKVAQRVPTEEAAE